MHKMTWVTKKVPMPSGDTLTVADGVRCECGWISPTQDNPSKAVSEFEEHAPDYCPHCMADPCRC